jgi:enoyl-CoA hydratase/carnithine racemase
MAEDVSVEVDGHIAILEIHRGPANYFDADLLRGLADAAEELESGGQVRALVLCSEGKHFCAGADFGSGALRDDRAAAARQLYEQGIRLLKLTTPIVAAVQGSAVGGGLGLACAADFRVASAGSRFSANFIVGEQKALELLLTANRIDGTEAHAIGLADRLVDQARERAGAVELARLLASRAPLATRAIKQTQKAGLVAQAEAALAHELAMQAELWQTQDSSIGIAASR